MSETSLLNNTETGIAGPPGAAEMLARADFCVWSGSETHISRVTMVLISTTLDSSGFSSRFENESSGPNIDH
jgi:hypothetical protein